MKLISKYQEGKNITLTNGKQVPLYNLQGSKSLGLGLWSKDGNTYVNTDNQDPTMAGTTIYTAKDKDGNPVRDMNNKLITGKTLEEAQLNFNNALRDNSELRYKYMTSSNGIGTVFFNTGKLWNVPYNKLKRSFSNYDSGEIYDFNNPIRVHPDSKNLDNILINDYVENNPNNIRTSYNFMNTTDSLIGDRKIPLSKFSIFYGIENGKLKADSLHNFDPNTVVVPNRFKNRKLIKKIFEYHGPSYKKIEDKIDSITDNLNLLLRDMIYKYYPELAKGHFFKKLFKGKNDYFKDLHEKISSGEFGNFQNYMKDLVKSGYLNNSNNIYQLQSLKDEMKDIKAINIDNDTIDFNEIGDKSARYPKLAFISPNHGGFLSYGDLSKNLSGINKRLESMNGAYPVSIDNGRYSEIETGNPSYSRYTSGDFERDPDNMFIIGNLKSNK